MILLGLSGLNLVISAQTIPSITPSTITILRMLGTVSCYVSTSILSQKWLGWSPLRAVGVLMGTLALTSIPVCLDLHGTEKKNRVAMLSPTHLYLIFLLLEIGITVYLLRP